MKKNHLWPMVCGITMVTLLASCTMNGPLQNEQTISPEYGPGAFGISQLKGMSKLAASTTVFQGTTVNFNLGSIKGSSAFYYLLYNIGKYQITNVTLTMSDSNMFSVYPAKIDTLIPGSDVGMLPIVKIVAYHGTAIDGAGSRPLMPKGPHSTKLIISGTTKTGSGTDTNVILSVGMDLTALVMDAELFFNDSLVDLGKSTITAWGAQPLDSFDLTNLHGFELKDSTYSIKIVNTGNVPFAMKIYYVATIGNGASLNPLSYNVPIGDTIMLKFYNYFYMVIRLDGNNTIANPLLHQESNGKCYFTVVS